MNRPILNLLIASTAFFFTAFFTPWWGSGVVALALAFMKQSSARVIAFSALTGWVIAIIVRDSLNENGPSRILLRFFQDSHSTNSFIRPAVILAIAATAALFAGSCAGCVTSLRKIWLRHRDYREN